MNVHRLQVTQEEAALCYRNDVLRQKVLRHNAIEKGILVIAVDRSPAHPFLADRVLALLGVVALVGDGIGSQANNARCVTRPRLAVPYMLTKCEDRDGFARRVWSGREREKRCDIRGALISAIAPTSPPE